MGYDDKLSLDQYMTLRKLLADIAWYKEKGRIDELSVQVKKNTGRSVYLHFNDEKAIERMVTANHKAATAELTASVSEMSSISEDTLDTIKIWSDMCFYVKNPRTFDFLCSATFNESISLSYGPLEIDSNAISDEEALHGDAVRRMCYYPRIPCGEHGTDFMFLASMGSDIMDCYTAFKNGVPIDENDALLMYDLYVNQYGEAANQRGEAEKPYQWESDQYKYYMGVDFAEKDFASILDADDKKVVNAKLEDTCLATHLSKLSYSMTFQPSDIAAKNKFLRGVFDVVSQTGYLPVAIVKSGKGNTRETIRGFVNKYGPEELIPVLDAAYFMNVNEYDRKMFNMQRRVCDTFVTKKEMDEYRQQVENDENYISDDSFGVRDIDEKDIPPDIDDFVK